VSNQTRDLQHWQPCTLPESVTLEGRWAVVEPLSAVRHGSDLWNAVVGEDHVWDWMADGPYAKRADFVKALEAKEFGTAARFFAICPLLPEGVIGPAKGYASLMRIDPANGVIEVGNVMFSPSLQRTAAATEAMYLMAKYVFEHLGYRRYEWKCNDLNLPSRRAADRFGFLYEGVFRQHLVIKGKNRDTAWYAMLDVEWPARKKAFEAWLAPGNFDAHGKQLRSLQAIAASPHENGSR
jgi:RimJ/RimL family protein N-acetyltransferase